MKAVIRRARAVRWLLLATAGVAVPASIAAQQQRRVVTPKEGVARFMVPTLRSTDRALGVQAADEIRARLQRDFSTNDLWVISKENVSATLEASGFPPNEPPDRVTARLLAQNLRADEYLEGTVARKEGGGFSIDASMVLTRDNRMVQPLPVAEGARLSDAASALSRSFKAARAQLTDLRRCEVAINTARFDDALAAANAATAAYPRSTVARICMANALINKKATPDSVLKIAQSVIEIDPRSRPALEIAAQAYTDANRDEEAVDAWTRLLALDPQNVNLRTRVVNVLAASGNAAKALPIIDTAVSQNPGDPELLRLQFLVRLTVAGKTGQGWKQVIESGEGLIRSDTAATDTTFYVRLATAYAADSQPQKAAETTARGVAKYQQNASLWAVHSRMLRAAGQSQQALDAVNRAISLDPQNTSAVVAKADIQFDLNQPDSAVSTLRRVAATADSASKASIAQRLLIIGNNTYRAANTSKNRSEFQRAISILAFADTVASAPNVRPLLSQGSAQIKFLLGVSAFQVAASAAQENQRARSCDLARLAQTNLLTAQLNVPAGGSFAPEAAQQLLSQIPQFQPAVDAQVKRDCR
ncbi:MAG: tetratricopeptide repeat protein [Gemmatimonadota bacterium]|nr:tetratricopeptide repeat protein [Gemmatimonadota bacterium]